MSAWGAAPACRDGAGFQDGRVSGCDWRRTVCRGQSHAAAHGKAKKGANCEFEQVLFERGDLPVEVGKFMAGR